MEAVALSNLFDACDKSTQCKVPVSELISALKAELPATECTEELNRRETLIGSLKCIVDPTEEDIEVDKDTWLNAWDTLADSPSESQHTFGNAPYNSTGANDFSTEDVPVQGELNQSSRSSYCFSPGSGSSSIESEPEELKILKQQNKEMKEQIKNLKQSIQNMEDISNQEQREQKKREKSSLDYERSLLDKINWLSENNEELKSSLNTCEREKLDLCSLSASLVESQKQLNTELDKKITEISSLNSDLDSLNEAVGLYKSEIEQLQYKLKRQAVAHEDLDRQKKQIDLLTSEVNVLNETVSSYKLEIEQLQQQASDHQEQQSELQDALQTCFSEKQELSFKLNSFMDKEDWSCQPLKNDSDDLLNTHNCNSGSSQLMDENAADSSALTPFLYSHGSFSPSASKFLTPGDSHSLFDELEAVESAPNPVNRYDKEHASYISTFVFQPAVCSSFSDAFSNFMKEETGKNEYDGNQTTGLLSLVQIKEGGAETGILSSLNIDAREFKFPPNVDFKFDQKQMNLEICQRNLEIPKSSVLKTKIEKDSSDQENPNFFGLEIKKDENDNKFVQTLNRKQESEIGTQTVHPPVREYTEVEHFAEPCDQLIAKDFLRNKCEQNTIKHRTSSIGVGDDLPNDDADDEGSINRWNFAAYAGIFFAFIFLVVVCTLLCTAAVLEIVAESGAVACPFNGSVPHWLKVIIRNFVRIRRRTDAIPF